MVKKFHQKKESSVPLQLTNALFLPWDKTFLYNLLENKSLILISKNSPNKLRKLLPWQSSWCWISKSETVFLDTADTMNFWQLFPVNNEVVNYNNITIDNTLSSFTKSASTSNHTGLIVQLSKAVLAYNLVQLSSSEHGLRCSLDIEGDCPKDNSQSHPSLLIKGHCSPKTTKN